MNNKGKYTQITKNESQIKKILLLIFIWSVFLFFLGLQYKVSEEYNLLLFWLPMLLLISVVIYQIFFFTNKSVVLFEIFIIYLILHLVFVVGYYGLRGSDSYIDFNILKGILIDNKFTLGTSSKGYPMIHIFSSVICFFTKINPLLIAKFLPSFISSFIVFPIYLLGFKLYGDKRVALLSCLIFGTIPQFMSFETSFVKEIFGLFVMILFFYLLCGSIRKNYQNFYFVVFLLIPIAILSHHLSSFLLLCLISIYLIVSLGLLYLNKIVNYLHSKIQIITKLPSRLNRNILLVVIVFSVSLVSYWFYIYGFDLIDRFVNTILDAIGVKTSTGATYAEYMNLGTPIITLKGKIIYYGFFFYVFLFAILLLIKIFIKNIVNKIEDSTFIVFFFFCMGLGFLSLFFISGSVFPDRLITFAFLFGLLPLTSILFVFKKNIAKKTVVVLFISFIVFNLYNIDTQNFTSNASFTGGAATEKEYLIAKHINFSNTYYGYIAAVSAIYDLQGVEPRTGGSAIEYINLTNFRNSSSLAIINEALYDNYLINLKQKSQVGYSKLVALLSYKDDINVDKICDFGRIYVIKGGK